MNTTARSRATRTAGALTALAALAGLLSACTPAPSGLGAMRLVDGRPALALAPCDAVTVDSISAYSLGVEPAERWHIESGSAKPPADVLLLDAPTGWTVTERTLTGFADDREYSVSAFADTTKLAPVYFTPAKLKALAPGQVLVGTIARSSKAVDESDWLASAEKSCADLGG
ncbi:hypothetical protein [Spirilliplanes yamanashiensis]|uniref:DUF2771 domain-containing protein n=1 Tax=Spirilliplanes yamanashiensis TaxID=42233 RepID=A0A8J3Y6C2_9ACTN|nr:hypothetical protein [Spirilliplanes yamanashiensis]MDP9814676.1 hypothetical protein [Spirilliplanes yamanashiensis]GIJ02329.1 hypothetical protein Sya03_16810 [Spirilliplanes yamanashiensis]